MSDELVGMTTAQFLEAARRAGEVIAKVAPGWPFPAASLEAADTERLYVEGFHYGLNDSEIAEVVSVWSHQTAFPVSHPRVRQAIVDRVMGSEWRPPNGGPE